MFVLHCFCCGCCRGWDGDKPNVGVDLPLADPWLEKGDPSVDDDFLLPSLSSSSPSSSALWGGDLFEAAVAAVVAAGVLEKVGVVDEVEDDGEFVGEIAAAAAENGDELFDDNVVAAAAVDEAAPPTLSAPNAVAVPSVPVLAAVSKPRDVEDTASSPFLSPSPPYPSPSSSRVDASPCPPP